ncbi:MAG: hypothetical protein CML68_10495 [Rhodobacteraceae bacterium]|nr:hypothetical protein [Paracoccaceae bacterium]
MPDWITSARPEGDERFRAGAALAVLDQVLAHDDVPAALLRARLALSAACACVQILGRHDGPNDLRDAVHLLRAGDRPGPAGIVFTQWLRAIDAPVSTHLPSDCLPSDMADRASDWQAEATGAPIDCATQVLHAALSAFPRQETAALILADATLARQLGWPHVVPLLAAGLTPSDLSQTGPELSAACHRALTGASIQAAGLAADLASRAARLRRVAPKLRARGAGRAVDRFLARDALSPSIALTDLMSDRAARRLCDRLVSLDAIREFSGRSSFRLYGL